MHVLASECFSENNHNAMSFMEKTHNVINTAFSLVQNSWIAILLPGSGPVYLNQQNWEKFPSLHALTL